MVKNLPANAGDTGEAGLIPMLGRSSGGGNGNPLQYSCLQKSHGHKSLAGYSPWDHKKVKHRWATEHAAMHNEASGIILNWRHSFLTFKMPTGSFQRVSLLLISEIFIAHLMETKNNLYYFLKRGRCSKLIWINYLV